MFFEEYISQTLPYILNGETKQFTFKTRVDPLSGNVSKISEERAKKSIGVAVDLNVKPVENCAFCNYKETTPQKHILHEGGAVTVPNKFPWEKYDWITIYPPFGQHKMLLSDLYFDDLERMIESSYDLCLECSKDPDVISFMDFTNWGVFAGASQQHPHSQRKSISWTMDPMQERELEHCRALSYRYNRNPFDLLADEERMRGERVIYDNDVFICSAFAPSCSDEVIVFPKEDISNILQTSSEDRRRIIRPILGIFPALFFYRGITDLNIVIHAAPFRLKEQARKYFRWHMHILPRRSKLPADRAGAELGFDVDIIDSLPEHSAKMLRLWYNCGPREEHVVRGWDGGLNHSLQEEFCSFVKKPVLATV